MPDRLRVAFVGHVDHGKSTLIGRLLWDTGSVPPDRMEAVQRACEAEGRPVEIAYLMDQLHEEREEARTIDTTQWFFRTVEREFVVIDAPGHREFLRNMLTGASQADAAVLIVDVAEGLCEQTRRHTFLLSLLGIGRCVVAVNKMDLAGYAEERFHAVADAAERLLSRAGLTCTACVPVCATGGDNVAARSGRTPWYGGPTVLDVLGQMRVVEAAERPLRLSVQDVYRFDGRRIVAGRVESGTLAAGMRVVVLPDGLASEVLTVERFHSDRDAAEAGECIGLTLGESVDARRGQVLCAPDDLPPVASALGVRLFWMADEPLRRGESLTLRLSTQETACRVAAVRRRVDTASLAVIEEDAGAVMEAEVGELDLELAAPVVAEPFPRTPSLGRVVLERRGPVVGAGVVLDLVETPPGEAR